MTNMKYNVPDKQIESSKKLSCQPSPDMKQPIDIVMSVLCQWNTSVLLETCYTDYVLIPLCLDLEYDGTGKRI